MKSKYEDLFNTLVKAYYEDRFEETIEDIVINHEISPQETFKIVVECVAFLWNMTIIIFII